MRQKLKILGQAFVMILFFAVGAVLAAVLINLFSPLLPPLLAHVLKPLLGMALTVLFICAYILKVMKKALADFRIVRPKKIGLWALVAVALPLCVFALYFLLNGGGISGSDLATEKIFEHQLVYFCGAGIAAGITEEMVFRGAIMTLIEQAWNKKMAVLGPSLFFALLHLPKLTSPSILDALLVLVAGTAVGVMFSLITYASGSVFSSALVHGMWNLLLGGGFVKSTMVEDDLNALYVYFPSTQNALLNGGAFGIEASLPAILGYVAVIIAILYWWGKRKAERSTE